MALGMLSSLSLNFDWSDLLLCSVLALSALVIRLQFASLRQHQRQADVTECKQAQQELQCLQKHLEQQVQTMDTILSASPDHFYMFDRDGRFIYASRAGLQALGLQKSDIIGKTEGELGFPPEVIEQHKQRRQAVFATGETLRGETSVLTVDGVRQHEYILTPIHDASGSVHLVVATSRDVTEQRQAQEELRQYRHHLEELVVARTAELVATNEQLNQEILERKQAEEELRQQKEVLQTIFDYVPVMLDFYDSQGKLKWINRQWEQTLGWKIEEIQERDILAEFYPEPEYRQYVINFIQFAEQAWGDFKTRVRDGRVIDTTWANVKLSDGSIIGIGQDITERKQAEEELQRQIRYQQLLAEITLRIRESLQIEVILNTTVTELQQLLQADRVLFYRLLPNCNGKVVAEAVVAGWQSLLGRELVNHCFEGEYLQQYQQQIHAWPDVEQAGFLPCHLERLRQFKIKANLIVPIFLKDKIWGMLFVHQCSAPRQWHQFEVDLLQQLANQLSIALAQAELLEQETCYSQDLARSNAELEQFAYVASHDLQEPLRTLASYAKLLSRRYSGQLDDRADRFIQYIVEEALRMQALINDLLRYSRVGRQAQNFAPCDTRAVFDMVVSRLQDAIATSGATVTCGVLPTVMADERQLVQLFQNLIGNAIKYRSQEPPVVQVAAVRQEGQWLFWVRDNGIGIDPKYAERIFVIFQRLHTQEEYSGTGIGLAIAAKIVERHGGRIWVESESGQGATFYFTLRDLGVSPF
ncbi:MAG: PAS domain S-box protein [Coleofasciculus sp. C3-bin4]|nr:PAS domain S-box protein [Coleofasciculus sp. C3-bin4]